MALPKTHKNCMIVGESGTGKSILCSVLSNPQREQGHYFLDPDFVGGNIRLNEEHGVSFIDTKPLTFNEGETRRYLGTVLADLRNRQMRITGWIFCVRYGRVKSDCLQLLNWVVAAAGQVPVSVYIANCRARPDFMIDVIKSRCGRIQDFYWLQAEVGEEVDGHLGRWIESSNQLEIVKERILESYGV